MQIVPINPHHPQWSSDIYVEKPSSKHSKLYNYIDGIPGKGFIRPDKLPNIDVIVPLSPQQAENLLHQPLDPLPHLPSEM
jgi:hypothetical protein